LLLGNYKRVVWALLDLLATGQLFRSRAVLLVIAAFLLGGTPAEQVADVAG
jgi:hypothetical protein